MWLSAVRDEQPRASVQIAPGDPPVMRSRDLAPQSGAARDCPALEKKADTALSKIGTQSQCHASSCPPLEGRLPKPGTNRQAIPRERPMYRSGFLFARAGAKIELASMPRCVARPGGGRMSGASGRRSSSQGWVSNVEGPCCRNGALFQLTARSLAGSSIVGDM